MKLLKIEYTLYHPVTFVLKSRQLSRLIPKIFLRVSMDMLVLPPKLVN